LHGSGAMSSPTSRVLPLSFIAALIGVCCSSSGSPDSARDPSTESDSETGQSGSGGTGLETPGGAFDAGEGQAGSGSPNDSEGGSTGEPSGGAPGEASGGSTGEPSGGAPGEASGGAPAGGGSTSDCEGAFEFERVTLDDDFTGEAKALADFDGDGLLDVAVGGDLLKWYAAPNWIAHEVAAAETHFIGHMQAGDIDADGDFDLVVPDGDFIVWFENPAGGGSDTVWLRHLVGDQNFWAHELELADFDLDGKLDIVTNPNLRLWLQGDTPLAWQKVELHRLADAEGLAVGAIDDDDRPDLAVRGHWIRTPTDPSAVDDYERFEIDDEMHDSVVIEIADVNGDGTPDVAYAPKEDNISEIAWYSAQDPEGAWKRHVVGPAGWAHEFAVVDFDGQGRMDFVFAEMSPSPTRRVGAFLQQPDGSFLLEVLATTGSHNIVVGDIGGDCDLDIAGSNWEAPPVEIFESKRCDESGRRCP
jgi:hypothetical protein